MVEEEGAVIETLLLQEWESKKITIHGRKRLVTLAIDKSHIGIKISTEIRGMKTTMIKSLEILTISEQMMKSLTLDQEVVSTNPPIIKNQVVVEEVLAQVILVGAIHGVTKKTKIIKTLIDHKLSVGAEKEVEVQEGLSTKRIL